MIKVICSRCECESKPVKDSYSPDGWEKIVFKCQYGAYVTYPLCPKCKVYLKLPEKEWHKDHDRSVADRLIEILEEIAIGVQD